MEHITGRERKVEVVVAWLEQGLLRYIASSPASFFSRLNTSPSQSQNCIQETHLRRALPMLIVPDGLLNLLTQPTS